MVEKVTDVLKEGRLCFESFKAKVGEKKKEEENKLASLEATLQSWPVLPKSLANLDLRYRVFF